MGDPNETEVFEFLDELRESGITNMFGAAPYTEREFGIQRRDARELLADWMRTFAERHPKED